MRELQAKVSEKEATIDDLKEQVADLEDDVAAKEETIEQLETDLSEYREMDLVVDEIESSARTILRQIGAADPDAEDAAEELADVREENRELQEELDEMRAELQRAREEGAGLGEEFESGMDFLRNEAVQAEIRRAAEQATLSSDHAFDIAIHLATTGESATNEELASHVDVGKSGVKKLTGKLHEHNVLDRSRDGPAYVYRINTEGLETLVRQQRQREQTTSLREELTGGEGR